jgi:mono/diheme cytochrome c family protein
MNGKHLWVSLVFLAAGVALVLGVLAVPSASAQTSAKPSVQPAAKDQLVARGKYLVNIGGCHDCHSPKLMTDQGPIPDTTRLLSGHPASEKLPPFKKEDIAPYKWVLFSPGFTAYVGTWGVTASQNLTPDENTGTGLWTVEMFKNAMRTGKHMGMGRPIMPPMPWPNVGGLSDEDLAAVVAYLKSIPPIKNAVPGPLSLDDYLAK